MYRIAICDNNVVDAQDLLNQVQRLAAEMHLSCTVDSFRGAKALFDAALETPYRLILLETEIGGVNGIDLARRIRQHAPDTDFIFVTGKSEYALAAYSVFPTGYVLKRATRQKLHEPFRHAVRRDANLPCALFRNVDGEELSVPWEDILYIEVFRTDLDLHCMRGTLHCVGSLSGALAALPTDRFYRSHRNFIVNLDRVVKIGKYYFGMENGDKVAVAKNRYTEARDVFETYLNR